MFIPLRRFVLFSFILAMMAGPSSVSADEAQSGAKTITIPSAEFDAAFRDFLKRHPEIIQETMVDFQVKQQAAQNTIAQQAVETESARIFEDPESFVSNPKGKITFVEFFDYSCHYCKQFQPDLDALIKNEPNLKVIYKELPILGPGSLLASKAALAAKKQGKYLQLHDALMAYKGQFDESVIQQLSETAGIKYDKLKADMDSPDIEKEIKGNYDLAKTLNMGGTPSMIIGKKLYGGTLPLEELKRLVTESKAG